MAPLDNCFVDRVVEPVQLIEIGIAAQPDATPQGPPRLQARPHQSTFSSLQDLAAHFDHARTNYACRYLSICQRNSWRPLQITKGMIDLLVSRHDINPSFWDLPSCFYTRNLDLEEVFCVPYTEIRNNGFIEISYTVKYPEYKPEEDKWVIRQSGIYHRFDPRTSQSMYLLLSPTPNSQAHQRAEEWLLHPGREAEKEPFWLHRVLFSTYYPAWRQYIAALERKFLPIANSTFATFIDEPLRIGYDNLSTLVSLENRFLQVPAILAPATSTLGEICALLDSMSATAAAHPGTVQLRNYQRQCVANSRTAEYLRQRTQTTAQLLSNTLSFRDQIVAKEQNGNMLQLNKSAVFITTLTLLYLPASFVATFFGMNFFVMGQDNDGIVGTPAIWIFIVSAAALTAVTFLFYYWLLQRDGTVFRRLAPKVRIAPDWHIRDLTRRLTGGARGAEGGLGLGLSGRESKEA